MKKVLKAAKFLFVTAVSVVALGTVAYADSFEDIVVNDLNNVSATIDVSSCHLTPQQAMEKYFIVVQNNPQFFYVENSVDCSFDTQSGECATLNVKYNASASDIAEQKAKFESVVNTIAQQAAMASNDFDKVKFVHDFLINNFQYDSTLTNDSAYDMFVNKTGICTAYTGAFNAVMAKLNIPCTFVKSNDMQHAWSMVQLGGNWYHVDVTWDDPIGGSLTYANFLKSDNLIKMTGHFNWTTAANVSATDTRYDTVS